MAINVIRIFERVKSFRNTNMFLLLVVILIGFPSGVNAAELPSAQPNQGASANDESKQGDHQAAKPKPANAQQGPTQTANPSNYQIENYNYNPKYGWDWSGIIQALATIGLVLFAGWQMVFVKRATKATEEAANAARNNAIVAKISAEATQKNAEAAELALKSDRPYLLVETAKLEGAFKDEKSHEIRERSEFRPRATFNFRNYGKGPALIETVVIGLRPMKEIPAPGDFTDCKEMSHTINAIMAEKRWIIKTRLGDFLTFSKVDYEAIRNGTIGIIAYGCIQYRDVFKNPYETAFCWCLGLPRDISLAAGRVYRMRGSFEPTPKTHNYST